MSLSDSHRAAMVQLRRALHRHPELSHQEAQTQARLVRAIESLGLRAHLVGGTGVWAEVGSDGPLVALRGDIDALPLHEATGVEFSSQTAGVMHACGHDVHAAATWGALAALCASPPPGRVRVIFQPAEELGSGAKRCIADGAIDLVQAIFGGHVDLNYPVGVIGLQPGPICASTDHFRIDVAGQSGHAARPHQGVDAALIAARIVVGLQHIVSREVAPGDPAVLTVGTLRAGDRYNVLAGSARLEGTLRAHSTPVRDALVKAARRTAQGIAESAGGSASLTFFEGNAPILNDPHLTEVVRRALEADLGPNSTRALASANMGGEDFSEYLLHCPGVYMRYGARGPGSHDAPAHSEGFLVDEGVLHVAAQALNTCARAAIEALLP